MLWADHEKQGYLIVVRSSKSYFAYSFFLIMYHFICTYTSIGEKILLYSGAMLNVIFICQLANHVEVLYIMEWREISLVHIVSSPENGLFLFLLITCDCALSSYYIWLCSSYWILRTTSSSFCSCNIVNQDSVVSKARYWQFHCWCFVKVAHGILPFVKKTMRWGGQLKLSKATCSKLENAPKQLPSEERRVLWWQVWSRKPGDKFFCRRCMHMS